jgi:hypothetical protein
MLEGTAVFRTEGKARSCTYQGYKDEEVLRNG